MILFGFYHHEKKLLQTIAKYTLTASPKEDTIWQLSILSFGFLYQARKRDIRARPTLHYTAHGSNQIQSGGVEIVVGNLGRGRSFSTHLGIRSPPEYRTGPLLVSISFDCGFTFIAVLQQYLLHQQPINIQDPIFDSANDSTRRWK